MAEPSIQVNISLRAYTSAHAFVYLASSLQVELPTMELPGRAITVDSSSMLAWTPEAALRTAVLRHVPQQQLLLTCNMLATWNSLILTFTTLSGRILEDSIHVSSESAFTAEDLYARAKTAALAAGLLASVNQPVCVLLQDHLLTEPRDTVFQSRETRKMPPEGRVRAKKSTCTVNLQRAITEMQKKKLARE